MTLIETALLIIIVLLILIFLVVIGTGTTRLAGMNEAGNSLRNIRKSKADAKISGVCAGLGKYTPMPAWIWRVFFLLLLFCGGIGLLAYIIFAICMPADDGR